MSIQGVQPKVSARLNVATGRSEIVDQGGRYIVDPQIAEYPEVPENEDLTMRMAAEAGIETPFHGMIYGIDGALPCFIRSFFTGNEEMHLKNFSIIRQGIDSFLSENAEERYQNLLNARLVRIYS